MVLSDEEKLLLEAGITKYGWGKWTILAESIPNKNRKQICAYADKRAKRDPAWKRRIVKAYDDNEEKVLVNIIGKGTHNRPHKPNIRFRNGTYFAKIKRNNIGGQYGHIAVYTTREQAERAYHIASRHYDEWSKTNPNPTEEDTKNRLVAACDLARNSTTHLPYGNGKCVWKMRSSNVTDAELKDIIYGPCYSRRNIKMEILCRVIDCQKFKQDIPVQGHDPAGCCRFHGNLFKRKYPGGEHQWAKETGGEIINVVRTQSGWITTQDTNTSVCEVVDVQPILGIPKSIECIPKSVPLKIREVLTRYGHSGKDAAGMTMDEIKTKVKDDYREDKYSDNLVEDMVKLAVNKNKVGSRMSAGEVTQYFLRDEDVKNKATSPQDKATNSKMAASTGKAAGADSKKNASKKKASRGTKRKYDSDDDEESFHSDMLPDGDEEDGDDDEDSSLDNGDEDNDGNMSDSSNDERVMSRKKATNDRAERMRRRQSGIPSQPKPPSNKTPKKKKSVPPPEVTGEEAAPDYPLSEYEQLRLERIKRNKARLAALGL